jgi:hypothetical protein
LIRPSSASDRINADVKVLLTLAMANPVDGVTRRFASTSASPLTPRHEDPSGMTMATDIPGIA